MHREIAVFSQGGDHGHEMRFTGAVVAYDHKPFVVRRLVKLKLRDDDVDQLLGHILGDDIGPDKLPGGTDLIGVSQLDHRFNRLELDQVSVFEARLPWLAPFRRAFGASKFAFLQICHRICPPALSFLVFMQRPPGSLPKNL